MSPALKIRLRLILQDHLITGFDSVDEELFTELGFEIVERPNVFEREKTILIVQEV